MYALYGDCALKIKIKKFPGRKKYKNKLYLLMRLRNYFIRKTNSLNCKHTSRERRG